MTQPDLHLPQVLAEVRQQAVDLGQSAWSELGTLVDTLLPDPMEPTALLPICTGMACGASCEQLVQPTAALVIMAASLRILDDCADEDNPDALYLSVGMGRAAHAAAALSLVSAGTFAGSGTFLLEAYLQSYLRICQGQEEDIRGTARTLEAYCKVVESKTVVAFEFAALTGAWLSSSDELAITRCRQCGVHLGWMTQILDDIEALWFPDSYSDLDCGRLTYPVLYGMEIDHHQAPLLRELCAMEVYNTKQICAVLDNMGVRHHLISLALDHRDSALKMLDAPLHGSGQSILQIWLDWVFRDVRYLLY